MASLPFILSALILVLLTASAVAQNNVLLTGQTLGPNHSQLSYGGAAFVMQADCNLVLDNQVGGFQSNTSDKGVNCTLSLTSAGHLIIRLANGSEVWRTNNPPSPNGTYAAVLQPDGQVAIYGPAVWSAPPSERKLTKAPSLRNVPFVENVLFSGQILYGNGKLTAGDYNFVMGDDCNLVLRKAGYDVIWQTGTSRLGEHCFVRLDHRGAITVLDDSYTAHYASPPHETHGDYVLVLQANGQAVIYGPAVWSTASYGVEGGAITMVTVE